MSWILYSCIPHVLICTLLHFFLLKLYYHREEIEYAIQKAKAVGPDDIPSKLLKLMDEQTKSTLQGLFIQ